MPSEQPNTNGELAARAATRKYNLDRKASSAGFYDAVHRSNGSKVGVKSALYERADGPGVFRVWRGNLRELENVGGSEVCVVVNPSNPERKVLKIEKIAPKVLLDVGEFYETGQAYMAGMYEARIPWPEVLSL